MILCETLQMKLRKNSLGLVQLKLNYSHPQFEQASQYDILHLYFNRAHHWVGDRAGMRWSQTANYGVWPNPKLPNSFGAQVCPGGCSSDASAAWEVCPGVVVVMLVLHGRCEVCPGVVVVLLVLYGRCAQGVVAVLLVLHGRCVWVCDSVANAVW